MKQGNNIYFFFKIAKEAGLSVCEDGEPCETYMKMGFKLKKPVNVELLDAAKERSMDDALQEAADILGLDMSLLTAVTEDEYLTETKTEDD